MPLRTGTERHRNRQFFALPKLVGSKRYSRKVPSHAGRRRGDSEFSGACGLLFVMAGAGQKSGGCEGRKPPGFSRAEKSPHCKNSNQQMPNRAPHGGFLLLGLVQENVGKLQRGMRRFLGSAGCSPKSGYHDRDRGTNRGTIGKTSLEIVLQINDLKHSFSRRQPTIFVSH